MKKRYNLFIAFVMGALGVGFETGGAAGAPTFATWTNAGGMAITAAVASGVRDCPDKGKFCSRITYTQDELTKCAGEKSSEKMKECLMFTSAKGKAKSLCNASNYMTAADCARIVY
ncbi:MAG: hypothetical protein LBG89_00890 [Rickettsiales bacterium]|jgi:hypothetical protein|nr:hypothetical protein [Rickettsiales bacterium]